MPAQVLDRQPAATAVTPGLLGELAASLSAVEVLVDGAYQSGPFTGGKLAYPDRVAREIISDMRPPARAEDGVDLRDSLAAALARAQVLLDHARSAGTFTAGRLAFPDHLAEMLVDDMRRHYVAEPPGSRAEDENLTAVS